MKQLRFLCILSCVLFFSINLVGAAPAQDQQPQLIQTVPIRVSVERVKPDDRGTDVSNMYTITVQSAGGQSGAGTYNILYYLDGVYVEEFKNQSLPYKFTRNYKGQLDQAHEIRIDLEDRDLRIVARQTTAIQVRHGQAAEPVKK